jgi:hypothetical protein
MASGFRNFRDGLAIYQIVVAIEHHLQSWTQPVANHDCIAFNRADLHGLQVNRRTLSALFREVHEELTSAVEHFQTQAAIKNRIAADQLVLIAIALSHGLVMHHLMDPRHYPEHLVTASSELVFDKLMGFTGK